MATAWKTPCVEVVAGPEFVSLVERTLRLLEEDNELVFTKVLDVVFFALVVTLAVELVLELDFVVEVELVPLCTASPKPYRRTGSGKPYAFARRTSRFASASSSRCIISFLLTNRSMARAYSNTNDLLKLTLCTIGISTTRFASGNTAVGLSSVNNQGILRCRWYCPCDRT